MYYCLPKSSFLPQNLLLAEFISWYEKDKYEVLNLKIHAERILLSYKIQSFGKVISFKYLCPVVYGHEDWPTITWGNKKGDLWEAPWAIPGLQGGWEKADGTKTWSLGFQGFERWSARIHTGFQASGSGVGTSSIGLCGWEVAAQG